MGVSTFKTIFFLSFREHAWQTFLFCSKRASWHRSGSTNITREASAPGTVTEQCRDERCFSRYSYQKCELEKSREGWVLESMLSHIYKSSCVLQNSKNKNLIYIPIWVTLFDTWINVEIFQKFISPSIAHLLYNTCNNVNRAVKYCFVPNTVQLRATRPNELNYRNRK